LPQRRISSVQSPEKARNHSKNGICRLHNFLFIV
jgi:hypothetical protein